MDMMDGWILDDGWMDDVCMDVDLDVEEDKDGWMDGYGYDGWIWILDDGWMLDDR